jgi:hypothetical protein
MDQVPPAVTPGIDLPAPVATSAVARPVAAGDNLSRSPGQPPARTPPASVAAPSAASASPTSSPRSAVDPVVPARVAAPPTRVVVATPQRASHGEVYEPSEALVEHVGRLREEWRDEELAKHPERRCISCRSYRAAEPPGRGWCVNPYAFPTQQLVDGDDRACLSFLGDWWVQADDHWLEKAGMPNAPTPLADGLIQLIREARRKRGHS